MPVLILNPNTNNATTAVMVSIAASTEDTIRFAGRTAPFGASMIVDPDALAIGAKAVRVMADQILAGAEPVEAVIIAAFGDPGLDAVRQHLPIPVCGIGEASFIEAAHNGRRFAVATTTPALEEAIAERVAKAGLCHYFAGSFFTATEPFEAVADAERLVDLLRAAIIEAGKRGAEAVIIGGGPLAMAAAHLRAECDLPIIEPVPAAARRIRSMMFAGG